MKNKFEERIEKVIALPTIWSQHNLSVKWRTVMQRIYCYTCRIRCDLELIVLEQVDIISIEAMLLKIQLRWTGHVSRMEDHHLPKIILYGELSCGLWNRGAPKKCYKDTLKSPSVHATSTILSGLHLQKTACAWRRTISKAASSFESSWRSAIEEKRQRRKNSAATSPNPDETFTCCHCNWTCRSRIGLTSHERACRKRGHLQRDLH